MIILNYPKLQNALMSWKLKDSIPNTAGFKLVVLHKDGFQILTEIVKDASGCHTIKDAKISDVLGWRNATDEDLSVKAGRIKK